MDRALRGNRLTKQPKTQGPSPSMTRRPRENGPLQSKEKGDALEGLGASVSGGIKHKPHSTREGRISAGKNLLNRFWGQKYKKKKGVPV